MDTERLKGKFRSTYLCGPRKIRMSFAKLLLQLKLAVKTPNSREVLLHSLPNGPDENPNEVPSSVDPLFVKFDEMGYVSEVFFVEIAGPILDKLGKHACVSITLNYMQFNISTYKLHMYRRNDCIEFRFQHNDFSRGDKMSEEEKSRCVQHCQSILKAVRSSLNESSKESYKCYGWPEVFAEYNEQHNPNCLSYSGRPIKMFWSQKIWFASPPPEVSKIDRCFNFLWCVCVCVCVCVCQYPLFVCQSRCLHIKNVPFSICSTPPLSLHAVVRSVPLIPNQYNCYSKGGGCYSTVLFVSAIHSLSPM